MTDLQKLSEAATPGEWRIGTGPNTPFFDRRIDADEPNSVGFVDEDDAAFIVALVNAYRSGQLVEAGEVMEKTAGELLRKINYAEAEIEEYIEDDTGLAPLEIALEALAEARALLSKLEGRG